MSPPALTPLNVAAAGALIALGAAVSAALSLGVARTLLVAVVRLVLQLILLALILGWLFEAGSPVLIVLATTVMGAFAGLEVMQRQDRHVGRWQTVGIGTGTMLAGGWLVTVPALAFLVGSDPWWTPRTLLPLFGMVAGSAMTGVALGLRTLTATALREAPAIEAQLALGATRTEALGPAMRESVRTALTPVLNAMAATGVVTTFWMMTGQLIAGADPMQAALYQMLVMLLIGSVSVLGTVAACLALTRRLTDGRYRLRLDRLLPG